MTTETAQPATLPILSHWIDGRPVEVLPGQTGPVYTPATGHVIGRVPRGGFFALYWAIWPQITRRALRLIRPSAASLTAPPTLSK